MDDGAALRAAIDLVHVPSRARRMRSAPLPTGIHVLLQIAAGDEHALALAAAATGRPREVVREAAEFFIEQALLFPDADSYRVLGAAQGAGIGELRRNMALLVKWLHPDRDRQGVRVVFAGRVSGAWDNLKTRERRSAYDVTMLAPNRRAEEARRGSAAEPSVAERSRKKRRQIGLHYGPLIRMPKTSIDIRPVARRGLLERALLFFLGRHRD